MALLSFVGSPHGGSHKLLPEWRSQPLMVGGPTTIVDHSIVGSALGAYYYFRDRTGTESHLIVRKDGWIWQLMDTDRRADANLGANPFAVSIETEDDGNPNIQPWTQAQLDSLIWLHEKLRQVHPTIPRRRVPTCAGGGLGFHAMCGVGSSNPWTASAGKTCPGKPARVNQWETVVLPAFLNPPSEEDHPLATMTEQERNALAAAIATALAPVVDRYVTSSQGFVSNKDKGAWGVFWVSPVGLIHVQSPAQYSQLSGEGLGEGNIISLPDNNPIWHRVPIYTELAVPTPEELAARRESAQT